MDDDSPHLWKLLWEYNPHGLIVVDPDLYIRWVNPAFCQLFKIAKKHLVRQPLETIFDDVADFKSVWQQDTTTKGKFREYPQYNLYVNQVTFAIAEEGLIASILVDISHELEQKRELDQLKRETIQNVKAVVDRQMKVAQEIAGLLGETTATTKVNLLKIIDVMGRDTH